MIAIPNVMKANRKAKYGRAAADSKTATACAVTCALEKNVYPTNLTVLGASGYGGVGDLDPWKSPYELSPAFLGKGPGLVRSGHHFQHGLERNGHLPESVCGVHRIGRLRGLLVHLWRVVLLS